MVADAAPVVGVPATPDRSRKRVKGAPTHVVEWELTVTSAIEKELNTRFHSGARTYNALLAEGLRRSRLVMNDPDWQLARDMPHRTKDEKAARSKVFNEVEQRHGFTKFSMTSYTSSLREVWVREYVGAHEAQTLAARVFKAVHRYHLGLNGKPRFKSTYQQGASRGLRSLEGKDDNSALKPWYLVEKDENKKKVRKSVLGLKVGAGLAIPFKKLPGGTGRRRRELEVELKHLCEAVLEGFLFARVVRRRIRGRFRYFVQFVVDGPAPARHEPAVPGTRGCFDLGPSEIAIAHTIVDVHTGEETWFSGEMLLAPNVPNMERELRVLQRRLDRQHRAGSPDCFNTDGTHKSGKCWWGKWLGEGGVPRSKNSLRTQAQIAEMHRRIAATRERDHGWLVNQMYTAAESWTAEKLNYVSWQKNFSRSVGNRAPGKLVEIVRRKAESAGDQRFREFNPYLTALSQMCLCGDRKKKPLNQRTHKCGKCGKKFPRDPFSAFLGLCIEQVLNAKGDLVDCLSLDNANALWPNRHTGLLEVPWAEALYRGEKGATKRRGRRRCSQRSLARIRARRMRKSALHEDFGEPEPTAVNR